MSFTTSIIIWLGDFWTVKVMDSSNINFCKKTCRLLFFG